MNKLPPEHYPQRTCRCSDCKNTIYAHTACYRVNGRNVCQSCGPRYKWSVATRTWTIPSSMATAGQKPSAFSLALEKSGFWHAPQSHGGK